ncbi:MAG: efflux RND transporter permease subunit [Alphaproteobacteria bacterium]|nr:efflux RND transporter permease subunit [Alphaproteobacteria bacterium]
MWIVRLALDKPYTFVVLALLLLVFGPLTILTTPKDIFPTIGIPVVSTIWGFTGLPPDEMADRITSDYERAMTTTVNDIEHIESQSLTGISVVKTFFQPSVNLDMAISQITAIAQTVLRQMPPGTEPPLIVSYNASSVPVIQMALSSAQLSEQELYDLGNNFIRTQLATVQGAALPFPYGGKTRQIQVDLNQKKLQALGLSAQDVNTAIGDQNLIIPAGSEKIGSIEYNVKLNASPSAVDQLNDLPIKYVGGNPIYIRDVAHVRDGFAPQINIVHMDGHRAVLMTILKSGNASTLDIVKRVRAAVEKLRPALPDTLDMEFIGDQSTFVRAAISGVVREGVIAAALTGLMILLFLGSWRSTLIILISIPLSVLASIIALSALGQTINIMTLGGLALAVGILVDDATVAIENINWHLEHGKEVVEAILDGARQIATPALVSTLCICIVFVPMFFLTGVAKFLFVPMAEAVIFAMLASYFLSRTLIPTIAKYLLRAHEVYFDATHPDAKPRGFFARLSFAFEAWFDRLRHAYRHMLEAVLHSRRIFIAGFLIFVLASLGVLAPWLGADFFPAVDAGQIKMHIRAPVGTRVEDTAALCDKIDAAIRAVIPAKEIIRIVDNIGLPNSGLNLSYSNSAPIGPEDADIMISLTPRHHPIADYIRTLRRVMPRQMPAVTFSFLPADIVSQILDFGLPAPIDVQIVGHNQNADYAYAAEILDKIRHVPGIADARIQQALNAPELRVNVDRTRAQELGITQHDVATDMLISLSGSFQTSPTFWLDPKNGVSYDIVTQSPQYRLTSIDDLKNIPVTGSLGGAPQILGGLATVTPGVGPAVVSHYNVQPTLDIFASPQDRDLAGVSNDIRGIIAATKADLPRGASVVLRGQTQTMQKSFEGLGVGLLGAILLVYCLIVINFQSWTDPFIIITALPGALAGIVWMLFVTHTRISVPALTGAIMCMGVATANSILVVSFARERMDAGLDAVAAALEAGTTRLRPVMMTALAMIIGMVPMAMGMGEGGEQNAPLGRAVIGGLIFATFATLFFVPSVFSLIHARRAKNETEAS